MKVYNIALLFTDQIYKELIQYSQQLHTAQVSEYVLGDKFFPHVILVQFASEKEDEKTILKSLSNFDTNYKINIKDCVLVPSKEFAGYHFEVEKNK